jgi:hypothetical protein
MPKYTIAETAMGDRMTSRANIENGRISDTSASALLIQKQSVEFRRSATSTDAREINTRRMQSRVKPADIIEKSENESLNI